MGRRDKQISQSIVSAVQRRDEDKAQTQLDNSPRLRLWRPLQTLFALYGLLLVRNQPELFKNLRNKTWNLSDEEYRASFKDKDALVSKGDMGYSGSVRFHSSQHDFLDSCIVLCSASLTHAHVEKANRRPLRGRRTDLLQHKG